MATVVSPPSDRVPLFLDAASAELEHANSSKSPNALQQLDSLLQSPFHDLGADALLDELWEEGANKEFKPPSYWLKNRGNYVRSYVLSNLRIQAKSTRLKVTVGWNLEALWDALPVDLIISIFEFLHPIDLYHAIRATRGLRGFLLNKNSTTIWKESFLHHPDIPFYPPDVSAPKWASLLFGPATCDTCGLGNCLVEYTLRQRKCNGCMQDGFYCDDEELLNAIQPIIGEFPDQLENLWSIGKKIYLFHPFHYEQQLHAGFVPRPRYFLQDVTERAHQMRKFLLDIRSGAPDAQANYEAFLSITGAAVQEHMKQARRCRQWARNIYENSQATFYASVSAFREKNENALLGQGHDSRDVEQAQKIFRRRLDQFKYAEVSHPVFSAPKLRRYIPQLESILQECIISRLSEERTQRRQGRICAFYFKITKEILRDKAPYLPRPHELYTLPFFADYIDDPEEAADELDASSAQQEVLSFLETVWAAKKRRLLAVLLETGLLPKEATENSNPDDFLGLAIAAFECCHSVFVGWEDADTHIQCSTSPADAKFVGEVDSTASFRFSDTGYEALKNLAELLHLDLRFALAKDLDTLNKRFVCKTCKFHEHARRPGLHAMTWRECLTHATKLLSLSPQAPRHDVFDVLSDDLTTSVLAAERPIPSFAEASWKCKFKDCYARFKLENRAEVVAHIKAVHGITPVEGIHFVYCRPKLYKTRTFLFVGLDENSNHRCLRCWATRKLWLRKKTPDLVCHILDKHAIQAKDLVEGADWIKVKAVEDDSWIEGKLRAEGIVLA